MKISAECENLYLKYFDPMYRFFLAKELPHDLAEDLAQQTFIKACTTSSQIQDLERSWPWLLQIGRNVLRNYFREKGAKKRGLDKQAVSLDFLDDLLPDESVDLDKDLLKEQQLEEIEGKLSELTASQRRCIELKMKGMENEDIAKILQMKLPTVKSTISQGTQRLRDLMVGGNNEA